MTSVWSLLPEKVESNWLRSLQEKEAHSNFSVSSSKMKKRWWGTRGQIITSTCWRKHCLHVHDIIHLTFTGRLSWLAQSHFFLSTVPFQNCVSHIMSKQRWLIESNTPLYETRSILSPFILTGEMNVVSDYDKFFCPIVNKVHTGPIFNKTHIFQTFWHTNIIFRTHTSGENWLYLRPVSVSATHSHEIWGLVLPALTDMNKHLNGLIGETMN